MSIIITLSIIWFKSGRTEFVIEEHILTNEYIGRTLAMHQLIFMKRAVHLSVPHATKVHTVELMNKAITITNVL